MTAQPEQAPGTGPTPAIPHTINAIGAALTGEQRALFYTKVLAAEEDDIAAVMRRWWKTAMLDRAPGAKTSRSNTATGRRLVAVEDLAGRLERAAGE